MATHNIHAQATNNVRDNVHILDVRDLAQSSASSGSSSDDSEDRQAQLHSQILEGLSRPAGSKELPTLLLYDELGLQLYDDITTKAVEYYPFGAEEEILRLRADEIIRVMHKCSDTSQSSDEIVLELGAGALRKTSHLLLGLSRTVETPSSSPPITYYALDLEENELYRTLGQISMSDLGKSLAGKVETKGICGTYDEGLRFIEQGGLKAAGFVGSGSNSRASSPISPTSSADSTASSTGAFPEGHDPSADSNSPLHILFLGSSLGNFTRNAGEEFLRSLPIRPGSGDTLLLGLDHNNGKTVIEEAYNDRKGYTTRFIMNGLRAAGRALGDEKMFDENKWEYVNNYNEAERRHEAFLRSKCDQAVQDPSSDKVLSFVRNELLKIEESHKYSDEDAYHLFSAANLRPIQRWTDASSQYSLWLLERPAFTFPLLSLPLACNSAGELVDQKKYSSSPFGVPSPQEWENLWTAWDHVTLKMIPPGMLHQKPIDLRHICLFYIGHIPTFLDIQLSRLLEEPHTEPDYFKDIFERGIDPDVDDPTVCHSHSEVPKNAEDWPDLDTILHFRLRVRARVLALYNDIDKGRINLDRKVGRVLFMTFEHEAMHLETLLYMLLQRCGSGTIPPSSFTEPVWSSLVDTWAMIQKPTSPTVALGPATITLGHDDIEAEDVDPHKALQVTDHEFGWDNESPSRKVQLGEFKIEWRPVTNGEYLNFYKGSGKGNASYPASWVEVDGETRVRTLYGPVPMSVARDWPVMTTYNNLSVYAEVKGGRLPTEAELRLFFDKFEAGFEGGSNVGFRNWHPIPATTGGEKHGGRGGNGGVWEWTSTAAEKYDGFVSSKLYPGYSSDFFDGRHNIVLGASYVTIPRIAGRRTWRNWYQRNYEYAWIGGRVVYDL